MTIKRKIGDSYAYKEAYMYMFFNFYDPARLNL